MSFSYQTIRTRAMALVEENVPLRRFARFCMRHLQALRYHLRTGRIPVNEKKIVFNSFNGRSYSCTPKAVYEYMLSCEDYKDYQFVWVVRNLKEYRFLTHNPRTTIVKNKSRAYERALASAKYWIFNYKIYDYLSPGKEQVYVQCWHGTPLKKLGYDIKESDNAMNSIPEIRYKYRSDAKKFSYLLSSSPFATEKFTSAWNLRKTKQEDKILELGYPRDDALLNSTPEDVQKIRERLEIPADKKVLLYTPTFRDDQHTAEAGYTYLIPLDFDELQAELSDEWIILFRAHYLVASSYDFTAYDGFIRDMSDYDDVNDLYLIADALVTDYSSGLFDYANLRRPMIFYMYDLALYENDVRGFYIDLEELPGPVVQTQEELLEKVKDMDQWFTYDEKYQKFNKKYNALNDGQASRRLALRVF